MLLERFGLWDVRAELVSTFSAAWRSGSPSPLTAPRPRAQILDEPYSALDEVADLLDRELAELHPHTTCLVATHDPLRLAALASGSLALS